MAEINISVSKAIDNFRNLRKELQAARSDFYGAQEGTDEYAEALARLSGIQKQITDNQELIRGASADLGDVLSNTTGALSGMVSGFSAVSAAMGLMGAESETMQAAMLKVQQAIQLVQGLSGLEGLTKIIPKLVSNFKAYKIQVDAAAASNKSYAASTATAATSSEAAAAGTKLFSTALKTLKAAIISTGIGALVVLLGELVAHWDEVSNAMNGVNDNAKRLMDSTDQLLSSQQSLKTVLDEQIEIMQHRKATTQEQIEVQRQWYTAQLAELELSQQLLEAEAKRITQTLSWIGTWRKVPKEMQEQIEATKQKIAEYQDALSKLDHDELIADIDSAVEAERAHEEQAKKTADALAKLGTSAESLVASYVKLVSSDTTNAITNYTTLIAQAAADTDTLNQAMQAGVIDAGTYAQGIAAINTAVAGYQSNLASLLEPIQAVNSTLFSAGATTEEDGTTQFITSLQAQQEAVQAYGETVSSTAEGIGSKWTSVGSSTLSSISSILSNMDALYQTELSNENLTDSERKKIAKKRKNMAIAQSLISTAQGIISAYTSALELGPVVGPIVGAANAALIAGVGAAQIATIRATDYSGTSSSGSASSSSSSSSSVYVPEVVNEDQVQYSRPLLTSTESQAVYDKEIWVSVQDINSKQATVQVRDQNSTF